MLALEHSSEATLIAPRTNSGIAIAKSEVVRGERMVVNNQLRQSRRKGKPQQTLGVADLRQPPKTEWPAAVGWREWFRFFMCYCSTGVRIHSPSALAILTSHNRRTPEYCISISPSLGNGRLAKAANLPISPIIAGACSRLGDFQSYQTSAIL